MPHFVVLATFTDQGIRNIKDTTKRVESFRTVAKKHGANVKDFYWTLGQYDCVLTLEAPDDETMTMLALSVGSLGNVHTQVLRAFTAAEIGPIVAKAVKRR